MKFISNLTTIKGIIMPAAVAVTVVTVFGLNGYAIDSSSQ